MSARYPMEKIRIRLPFHQVGHLYGKADYWGEYPSILRKHGDTNVALCELFMFNFWLVWRSYQALQTPDRTAAVHGSATLCAAAIPALQEFEQRHALDLQATLGDEFEALASSRFGLYDQFCLPDENLLDPSTLRTLAMAVACQLFWSPCYELHPELMQAVRRQYARTESLLHDP